MKNIFDLNIPVIDEHSERINNLNTQLSLQRNYLNSISNTCSTTEQNKKEKSELQSVSESLQKNISQQLEQLNNANNQKSINELALKNFPKQIDQKEKLLVSKEQKLTKLQSLDKIYKLLSVYEDSTDTIILIKEACIKGDKSKFDTLLTKLDNINRQDHEGKTALMHAIEYNFLYAIDKLLENKINVHIIDQRGNNALHITLLAKKDLIAEKIIKYDETIATDKDAQGRLPLYIAFEQLDKNSIKLLFSEVNAGYALIYAIQKSNYQIAGAILNIDKKLIHFNDTDGKSPLSIALGYNKPDIVQLLLSNGANLAEALESNKSIKHLNLNNVYLDQYRLNTVGEDLKFNHSIIYLSLQNCGLKANNTNNLWEFLKSNRLNYIDISHNNLGYEGAKIFAKALEQNTSVESINLSRNNITEAGAIFIATLLKANKHILSANIADNNIGDVGAIFIANALGNNTTLVSINLTSNNIGIKGFESLADALTVNHSVASIELKSNNINVQGINFLIQSLKNNFTLITLLGVDDQEQYISTKIAKNNEVFLANIESFKSLETLKYLGNDNIFKKLFITFKQLQSQSLVLQEQTFDHQQQKFYFQKIIEAYNYFTSSQVITNMEEGLYASELLGQLTNIQENY